MKLIGSKQEQQFRDELRKSHRSLFFERGNPRLLKAIRSFFPEMETAYIIQWVPDQDEDVYAVLINTDTVVWIELHKTILNDESIVQRSSVHEYQKKLKKIGQIQLSVALDLANSDKKSTT